MTAFAFNTFADAVSFICIENKERAKHRSQNTLRSTKKCAEVMGGNIDGVYPEFSEIHRAVR
jgi:hypothetical protein